jgi:hypothetical protein
LRPSVLITGIVSAGVEISGATGIVVVDVVVVDVVVEVVELVELVDVVVVGALLFPEQEARKIQSPAITNTFFDIFLISLRCSIELFQILTFRVLTTQH